MSWSSTLNPITLFRNGMDTLEIARLTGRSEAEVYNSIHKARTRRIYQVNADLAAARKMAREYRAARKRLVKYAGHPGR